MGFNHGAFVAMVIDFPAPILTLAQRSGGHLPHLHGGVGKDIAEGTLAATLDEIGKAVQMGDGALSVRAVIDRHQRISIGGALADILAGGAAAIDAQAGKIGKNAQEQVLIGHFP